MEPRIRIIIPAYNEEKTLGSVIDGLRRGGYDDIVVVDDGSKDRTAAVAKQKKVYLLSHVVNRGLGGALCTGIMAAVEEGCNIIVTFDADGQHDVRDIKKVILPIMKKEVDVVIGSRMINSDGMPLIRRIGNRLINIVTYVLFGVYVTDSQSGLRAFSLSAAKKLDLKTNRMEVSSEIIKEIGRNKLRFKEVPIRAIYTEYSMKKGQSHFNGVSIVLNLCVRKIMR